MVEGKRGRLQMGMKVALVVRVSARTSQYRQLGGAQRSSHRLIATGSP